MSEDLEVWFGETLSRDLASGLEERISVASAPVLEAAAPEIREEDAESHDFTRRVQQLNCELFGSLLPDQLHRTTFNLLASEPRRSVRPDEREGGGVLGRPLGGCPFFCV